MLLFHVEILFIIFEGVIISILSVHKINKNIMSDGYQKCLNGNFDSQMNKK
jgi:hypothetical protein